jgi:DNA-directed RNA polymerase subunit omega
MHDELKEELIVNRAGGRFKLSTLIQKRMIALNQGARELVNPRGLDRMSTVIREIMEDKIYLDLTGNVRIRDAADDLMDQDGGTVDLTQTEG